MKVKIFISILLIFLVTGCTPNLKYTILDGQISEKIEIPFGGSYTSDYVQQKLEYYSNRDNLKPSIEVNESEKGYTGIVTLPNMSMSAYFKNKNTLINECYEMVSFTEEEKKYYLNTSTGFNCMTYDYNISDEITITVETYNKVYQHNADEQKGNKYTWKINDHNAKEHSILFVVGNKEYVWYYKYQSLFIGLGIVLVIFMVISIMVLIFKNYFNKVNKI